MKKINNKGFSLVELLATITILGILMTVGIASYSKYVDKARESSYQAMGKSAKDAIRIYFANVTIDKKTYCDNYSPTSSYMVSQQLQSDGYLEQFKNPRSGGPDCMAYIYYHLLNCNELFGTHDPDDDVPLPNFEFRAKVTCGGKVVYDE